MSLLIPTLQSGPKGSPVGKILSVAYQRNGVGGSGFYTVNFHGNRDAKDRVFWAVITFSNDDNNEGAEAFVFDPASPGDGWRGTDHYGPSLFAICRGAKWPHEVNQSN